MAEVAAAASIIQLIEFSGKVCSTCYDYISKARSASSDIERILGDVSLLETILKRLQLLISDENEKRHVLIKSLARSHGPFEICKQALEELQKRLTVLVEASSTRKKLLWPIEEKRILQILTRLGEQRRIFLLALAGDQSFDNDEIVEQGKVIVAKIEDGQAKEERNKILNWLGGVDPSTNYNLARRRHEKGTGEWLLQSEIFKAWESSSSQTMWLFGKPGAGKTILSSTVIHHLTSHYENRRDHRVAYFYFDFNDVAKQTSSGCLKSLVQQIFAQTQGLPDGVLSMYSTEGGKEPSLAQLKELLISLLSESPKDVLVIDALDECKEEEGDRERTAVFDTLHAIKDSVTGPCSIFITSRPEADIKRNMDNFADIHADVRGSGVDNDIQSHIIKFIEKDKRMKAWSDNVKDLIVKDLTEKSDGMFRWVSCQLESLRTCLKPRIATIQQKLADLPRTLNGTYERIFNQMDLTYQREIRTVLMLLAFSQRPMTIQEVVETTAISLESRHFDIDDRFVDPYDILELCSSLVSVVDPDRGPSSSLFKEMFQFSARGFQNAKVLQYALFSVKEYILSNQMTIPPAFRLEFSISQKEITVMCLIYLLDFNDGRKATVMDYEGFPFLIYAALHWPSHMAMAPSDEAHIIEELLVRLFDVNNLGSLMNFLNVYNPAQSELENMARDPTELKRSKQDFETPLYYASYFGLLEIAHVLAREEVKADPTRENLGSALCAAAVNGHYDIVKMLLNEGTDPNSSYCGPHYRPLDAAVAGGNVGIVKLLLEAGAIPDKFGGPDGTALHIAVKQGNPEVVRILVTAGHDINTCINGVGTPLLLAAERGRDEILEALLHSNADPNIFAGIFNSPLSAAAANSSLASVKLLLDAGAELDGYNVTPLHNAAGRPDLQIMRLLIARGADVNAFGGFRGTPLKASIRSRDPVSFQLMLDSGANINERGSTVDFPVDQAILEGNLTAADKLLGLGAKFGPDALKNSLEHHSKAYLAKKLLELGADPNAEHKLFGNMLQLAVVKCSIDALIWLLGAGAEINAIEGEFGTALQAACVENSLEAVSLLLNSGASVKVPSSGMFGNALQAAVTKQNEEIVRLLLAHGADVNIQGGPYGTALQAASRGESEQVSLVKILLQAGADVNVVGGQYGTAFRASLASGHEHIARLLLDHGADPMDRPYARYASFTLQKAESPLPAAASSGKPDMVQLLLNCGLDLNIDRSGCRESLCIAAHISATSVLELLISKGLDIRSHGSNALQLAILHRSQQIAELLLEYGANINHVNSSSRNDEVSSALQASIHNRDWSMMHRLIDAGTDINLPTPGLWGTALEALIEMGTKDLVLELLDHGAEINIKAGRRGTPLTRAVQVGDDEIFKLLLERGADPNLQHGEDGTALQVAMNHQYYDMAHQLLDEGADPNLSGVHANALISACSSSKPGQIYLAKRLISMGVDIDAFDKPRDKHDPYNDYQFNPLCHAAITGNLEVAEILLNAGSDIHVSGGTYGTVLQFAAMRQQNAMVKFLLKQGADVNATGGAYATALQAATIQSSNTTIALLLDAGADVNIEGGKHGSPLQAASYTGIHGHVKLLLEHGAKVNTNCGQDGNPLQTAARKCHIANVKLLLDYDADVNATGGEYNTALQAACSDPFRAHFNNHDALAVIELLLSTGADVNAVGGKYGTALQAAAYHNRSLVEILLKNGADPNIGGGEYGCPLRAARAKKLPRIVKLLLQYGARDDE